jgi:hypothetical protein
MTEEDLLLVLGHNLDGERSYFHEEFMRLDRMEKVVERLPEGPARTYFKARISQTRGERHAAVKGYDRLIRDRADAPIYPFPIDHWRMRYTLSQAARIEKARVVLEVGADDTAKPLLRSVLEELPEVEIGPPSLARLPLPTWKDGLAKSPLGGWFLDGAERFDTRVETDGTLRVQVVEPKPSPGAHTLSISAPLPEKPGDGRRLRFSIEARREGNPASLTLAIGVPDGKGWALSPVGSSRYPLILEWVRHEVEIDLQDPPEGGRWERVTLFAFFRGPPGAKVWFLEPRLERGESTEPPTEDEIARFKAREFVRTLLKE